MVQGGMMTMKGIFSARLQRRRKSRKVDKSLIAAIQAVVPGGSSIIDLGAGVGQYVQRLRELGYRAAGIDGTPDIEELSNGLVRQWDLTSYANFIEEADWGLLNEVGEHIPKELEYRFLQNISAIPTRGLIVCWATPGRAVQRHVNCRLPEYVASRLAYTGWILAEVRTMKARAAAGRSGRRLMVFRPTGRDERWLLRNSLGVQ